MQRLVKRLNGDDPDHYAAMLIYARYFNLPYVEEGLIELMEFWADDESETVVLTLTTANIEVHRIDLDIGGIFLYVELIEYLGG
jgi:hypothetical protein